MTINMELAIAKIKSAEWFRFPGDIEKIVAEMCQYPDGYLLVTSDGEKHWCSSSQNMWLDSCEWIRVPANCDNRTIAAHRLLAAVRAKHDVTMTEVLP